MKKTISANIGGIVFHIEEDAFQVLSAYLEKLRRHYAAQEGGSEILSDIEARLAELFSAVLSKGRQVIALADAETVMRQVGSVEDITGEIGGESSESAFAPEEDAGTQTRGEDAAPRRLYRDLDQIIIGGVCSGIAAWFGINPLWVRLGFAAVLFGAVPFLPEAAGPIFLAYVILWIAVPGRHGLKNPGSFRRFFLSRRDKVLGGVCGGVGQYFNIDPTLVRVLFVLALFLGGGGFLIYLVLWIITPEASSLSDEIRMEGQQVNIQTLEAQVKKRLEPDSSKPESTITKILLFPFRLLSTLLEGLKPLLHLAVDLVRIFAGLLLLFVGGVLLFAFGVATLSLFGYLTEPSSLFHFGDLPVNRLASELSPLMVASAGITALIPSFFILMLGISLMVKRKVMNRLVVAGLAILFFISAILAVVLVIPKIKAFQKEGLVVKTMEFIPAGKVLSLQLNQNEEGGMEENVFHRSLRLVSYDGKSVLLRQRFRARGSTAAEAKVNARAASLEVVQMDSSLIFNEELKVDPAVPFRAQSLEMILYIPRGMRLKIDNGLYSMLENQESEDSESSGEDSNEDSEDDYEKDIYRNFNDLDEETIWTLRGSVLVPANEGSRVLPDSSSEKK
jgi:phage shock protein PspC (stress-responsive transcriptional regulator)